MFCSRQHLDITLGGSECHGYWAKRGSSARGSLWKERNLKPFHFSKRHTRETTPAGNTQMHACSVSHSHTEGSLMVEYVMVGRDEKDVYNLQVWLDILRSLQDSRVADVRVDSWSIYIKNGKKKKFKRSKKVMSSCLTNCLKPKDIRCAICKKR